jgi:hypothetical protein
MLAISTFAVMLIPFLERPKGALETQFPPFYSQKILALLTAILTPVALAGLTILPGEGKILLLISLFVCLAGASALAFFTTGPDFQLSIDTFRGFNLEWMLPLLASGWIFLGGGARWGFSLLLLGIWLAANTGKLDLLAYFDLPYAESHVHHISKINRMTGRLLRAFGPRPARKWAGIGPLAWVVCFQCLRSDRPIWAAGAAFVALVGFCFWLEGFRRPERGLAITTKDAAVSLGSGFALAFILLILMDIF